MRKETKEKIKEEIFKFAKENLPQEYSLEELKKAFPFHSVFFTDEGLRAFKVQRTLVTKMGMKLYPKIALLIAREKYTRVFLNYKIEGEADRGMIEKANTIIKDLREGKRKPNMKKEWEEIIFSASNDKINVKIVADFFAEDSQGRQLFMEIKSPLPNLDVCAESKRKMLFFKIIKRNPNVETYLAFPYNPFVPREKYSHRFTFQIMDIEHEVLIGEEMWNKIGGEGTFEELLKILDEVKKELKKYL